jgi:hypothetical protein
MKCKNTKNNPPSFALTGLRLSLPHICFGVKKYGSILLLLLVVSACLDQPDCYNLTNNTIAIAFRKLADGQPDTVKLTRQEVQGATVTAVNDKITSLITSTTLPLDYTTTQSTLTLTEFTRSRSVTLNYAVQKQFVSEECGPRFIVDNLTIANTFGDSMRVVNATPGAGTNIIFYRCPKNDLVKIAFKQRITADSVRKDSVNVLAIAPDITTTSLSTVTGRNISFLKLPLDLDDVQTSYTLTHPTGTYQLTFTYQVVEKTVYEVCGVQKFITNLTASSPEFDVKLIETTKYVADSVYDPPKINFALIQ